MSKHNAPTPNKQSTAADFLAGLSAVSSTPDNQEGSAVGSAVRMRDLFALAKKHMQMAVEHIEALLQSSVYEQRLGAVSIMDWQARDKKTTQLVRKALFDLYINRHDCINDWSLVDRAAPYVVGGFLYDKPRKILHQLAASTNLWERRTAITSTYYFIRQKDLQTTFDLAALLVDDPEHFVQTAVGGWLREAGKKDRSQLIQFLDQHHTVMPPTMLRSAIEHLDKTQREQYVKAKKTSSKASSKLAKLERTKTHKS